MGHCPGMGHPPLIAGVTGELPPRIQLSAWHAVRQLTDWRCGFGERARLMPENELRHHTASHCPYDSRSPNQPSPRFGSAHLWSPGSGGSARTE